MPRSITGTSNPLAEETGLEEMIGEVGLISTVKVLVTVEVTMLDAGGGLLDGITVTMTVSVAELPEPSIATTVKL